MKTIYLTIFVACSLTGFSQVATQQLHTADSLYSKNKWQASAAAYTASLQMDDKNGRAWYRLGACYQNMKRFPEAIEAYKKSIELKSPVIPPIIIRGYLAKAYSLNKDSVNTLLLLEDMVSLGYGNFADIDTATEYKWLRASARFKSIVKKAESNAFPCLNNPHHREFDFWVGQWNVYQTGTDYLVGISKVENVAGGCLILENWTPVGFPGEGKSMNFIDPKTNRWEQVWMSANSILLNYHNGEYRDSAMHYEGEGVDKVGNKLLFHLTYFHKGPGEVRQLLEQSQDAGKTWIVLYDFTYRNAK